MSDAADLPPSINRPFGVCPWCGRQSNFRRTGNPVELAYHRVYKLKTPTMPEPIAIARVSTLTCMGETCQRSSVVVEERSLDLKLAIDSASDDRTIPTLVNFVSTWRGVSWWPLPGQRAVDESIPKSVQESYAEGMRALAANAPNAASSTFRSALVALIADKGSTAANAPRDLTDRLKVFIKEGGLSPALGDWADHVKLYGNAGAHPDVYGPVTPEEATDVAKLVHSLFEMVYVLPANIAKRRGERMPEDSQAKPS